MSVPVTGASLSPSQRRLVDLMRRINYGRIEALHIRAGAPAFDPAPRVVRKVKIGGENGPQREPSPNAPMKKDLIEMFEHMNLVGDGVVRSIEVKNGMPFSLDIEETVGA